MQAKSPGEKRALRSLDEANVFIDPCLHFCLTIAICHFVTKHSPQACLFNCISNDIKRTVDCVWRGMMINESSCAMFDSVHKTGENRISDAFRIQRTIQRPPQLLQDLREIFGGRSRDGHTARISSIEMSMCTDVARHYILAARIQRFNLRIS